MALDHDRWQGLNDHRLLAIGSSLSEHFLATWQAWRTDPLRSPRLHYVAMVPHAQALEPSTQLVAALGMEQQIEQLRAQCIGLLPGFHRLSLEGGQLLLTLCLGTPARLDELDFAADEIIWWGAKTEREPSSLRLKELARLSRQGTSLVLLPESSGASEPLRVALAALGFEPVADPASPAGANAFQFLPRWARTRSRREPPPFEEPGRCAVIGAGLAGASVAASLARRGWQVQVLDQALKPAGGASGLPAGLVVPHVSPDDSVLSRLSRAGVRLTLAQARALLRPGLDWEMTGVLEHLVDGATGWPKSWQGDPAAQSQPPTEAQFAMAGMPVAAGRWHAQAGWIKPACLVEALLKQPGVTFRGEQQVDSLEHGPEGWSARDAQGIVLAQADLVVLAAGPASMALSRGDVKLQPVRGQVSWALHSAGWSAGPPWPACPVNGDGSLVPDIPTEQGSAWYLGSTFIRDNVSLEPSPNEHEANYQRLRRLLPAVAQELEPSFRNQSVEAWTAIRCTTVDRMPVVGPVRQAEGLGLWICSGMGARGLSFAVLCGELLAARLHGEPLPVERRLARALDVSRLGHRA